MSQTLSASTLLAVPLAPLAGAIAAGVLGTQFGGNWIGRRLSHSLTILGVLVAFPMKRRFINDEQQPFPEGRACAVVLDSLYPDAPKGGTKNMVDGVPVASTAAKAGDGVEAGVFKAKALAISASIGAVTGSRWCVVTPPPCAIRATSLLTLRGVTWPIGSRKLPRRHQSAMSHPSASI